MYFNNYQGLESTADRSDEDPLATCEYEWIIYEEELVQVQVSKFAEGILVGGHILIMIFSGCGNIAALIIVVKSKAPKLTTKYFLIMLALSDLLMITVAPPTEIAKLMGDFNEWIFGALMCKLVPFLQIASATMSAMCLMAIAAERNFLIVRAMSSSTSFLNKLWEKWILPVIVVSIILLPIGSALPQIWYYTSVTFLAVHANRSTTGTTTTIPAYTSTTPSTSPSCDVRRWCVRDNFDKTNIIYWSVTGVTYFSLLLCFLISYISIYIFVKRHGQFKKQLEEDYYSITVSTTVASQNNNQNEGPPHNKSKFAAGERHRKTLKLILGLILLHLCCRAPNWVYLVLINVYCVEETEVSTAILEFLHLLSTVNCALNPFLYVIWNHSLRANGDTGGASDMSRSSMVCKKTVNILSTVFCCCCSKNEEESVESHLSTERGTHRNSSAWSWKTPRIYHVSSRESNENKAVDLEHQYGFYHEKSEL